MTDEQAEARSEQTSDEKRTQHTARRRARASILDSSVSRSAPGSIHDLSVSPRVPRIGLHLPIASGLHNALLKAQALGCDTVQIFSRNPRGWMARPLDVEEIERFRRVREETRISPVVVHCNYLVNLAAANSEILMK